MRRLVTMLMLAAALPLWTLADPAGDERDRRRLEQLRRQPEQLQRLRQEMQKFLDLPPDRRERLRKLDHDLHAEPPASQAKLSSVLDRFADWLEALPEKERDAVRNAPNSAARLTLVRELRDQEWMRQQPKALREQWAALKGDARADFVRRRKQDEFRQRKEWQIAAKFWKELDTKQPLPVRLADFPVEVQRYVNDFLMSMLSKEEKERLSQAAEKWPDYAATLVALADRHPAALPGANGPRAFDDLPNLVKLALEGKKMFPAARLALKPHEGRWPQYGSAAVDYIHKSKKNVELPSEIWASGYKHLSPPMKEFVDKKLKPLLDGDEKLQLAHKDGIWPDYPLAIQELAQKHQQRAPWFTLPELPRFANDPRFRWDNYRVPRVAATPNDRP